MSARRDRSKDVVQREDTPAAVDLGASLWLSTASCPRFPQLHEDLTVDVVVIGGGIVGVVTAYLLKTEGKRVALLEMRRIGQGTTGLTTAKLTVGQSLIYARLLSAHGLDAAKVFAESNTIALDQLAGITSELGIDCDWETTSNYVYTESPSKLAQLEDELSAMRAVGIPAELTRETELPFPVAGAIRVDAQAQFHPVKFLARLVARIPGDESYVFEESAALSVRSGDPCLVRTGGGRVRADHVVVATQLPFLDRGLYFARAHPQKSHAVAARLHEASAPRGMYINVDEPTRSIRSAPAVADSRYLIVGGESSRPGEGGQAEEHYAALEAFTAQHFRAEAALRWSAHDYVPVDGLPYIGRLHRWDARVYVATGFAKWGLTKGMVAARIISDAILGRANPWSKLYDSGRITPRHSAKGVVVENGRVAWHFLIDRLRPRPEAEAIRRIAPGEGTVVRVGARHLAVYRDDRGTAHVLSARCPHLGCLVEWSEVDRTWECPCHGSRFSAQGVVIQGPATEDLGQRDLSERKEIHREPRSSRRA